jgi:iron complex outermembrane receptor protein
MKNTCLELCLAFLCLTGLEPLFAQDNDSSRIQLDTVKMLAPAGKADSNAPCSYQTIRRQEYQLVNIGQEPSILLSQLSPSVTFYSDAGSGLGYSYFRMRGMDQTRINMTLNGVPLNEPEDQGVYFSNYPDLFKSISEIQVQRGVGLSQNGTASYAGSIQMEGPVLIDSSRSELGLGFGSFNTLRVYAEHFQRFKGKSGIYIRGSHLQSSGYKHHAGNQSQSLFLNGQFELGKHLFRITNVSGRQANQMAWLGVSDSLIQIDPRTNGNSSQEDDRFIQSLSMAQHYWYPGEHLRVFSTVYYNFLDGNYDFDLNNFLGLPSNNELYNYAFRSHFVGGFSQFRYQKGGIQLDAGLHANRYVRTHTGSEASLGQLYQNAGIKREGSAFLKASYSVGKWMFLANIEERLVDFDYEQSGRSDLLTLNFFNPRAAVRFSLTDRSSFYYSIGRVGREPTRTDLFGGMDSPLRDSLGALVLFIQNPEYVLGQELGWHYNFNRGNFAVNLFWMQFQDEITLNGKFGPNGLALNSDFAKSYRAGLEWNMNWRIAKGLTWSQNGCFNRSRIEDQGEVFQPIYTPWILVNQGLAYDWKKWTFGLDARYQGSSYMDFANTTQLEDYILLNLQAAFHWRKWSFKVLANNVLNTRYFNQGYVDWDGSAKYFVQAPFNLHGMVSIKL